MPRRTIAQAGETRGEVLRAARELFTVQGFAATSMASIGERAGLTKGAVFHHFESKEALFVEVWTGLQTEMDAAARESAIAQRSKTDPYAAFLAGCRVYFDWCLKPDFQRIVLVDGPSVLGMARWHELDFQLGSENMTRGAEFLARQGEFPLHLARPAAVLLQGALNGAGFALSAEHPEITPEDAFETFERLLRGLR
jgi:AcrR family transcriptional regulator